MTILGGLRKRFQAVRTYSRCLHDRHDLMLVNERKRMFLENDFATFKDRKQAQFG